MHVNNACFMPHMHLLVWKSQNGAKTLVNLGAGKKLTCFDPLRKGCRFFLIYFLTTIGPVHHTYNIQLTKK
jgi:hypothetical protein